MDRRRLSALVFLAVAANGAAIFCTVFYKADVISGREPPQARVGQAFVQIGRGRFGIPPREEYSDVVLPTERDEVRKLEKIHQLTAEGYFSDAAILLDRMLGRDEDSFFVPGDDKTNFRSLKLEAMRLIGNLPIKGHEAYQLQFGTLAEKMLAEAVRTGDIVRMTEVSRRYFHTLAGYEATFLLGRHHLDHGRPLAAAICYQQLLDSPRAARRLEPTLSVTAAMCWLRAGNDRRAEQTLLGLKNRGLAAEVRIAGQPVRLFAKGADSLAWLERSLGRQLASGPWRPAQWTTFRGGASRNGESAGGRPLLAPRWRVRIANSRTVEEVVKKMQQSYASRGIAALPSLHPLAVGDVVLMRTVRHLIAVDFRTGKRVWDVKPDQDNQFKRLVDGGNRRSSGSRTSQLAQVLERRLWGDVPYGTLSSDGRRVYVIQGLGLLSDGYDPRRIGIRVRPGTGMVEQAASNRLSAFELRSQGKLLWEIGGADSEIDELQDAFFLGPPLALSGALHALVEIRGGIRLVVLEPSTDSATGRETVKLAWSQQLADVEQTIFQDPTRRLAGAMPSFADGVLVCPTSAGAVVAVDLARRSLLWAYKYPQRVSYASRGRRRLQWSGQQAAKENDRWVDATATLVAGRVLLTPIDSGDIHCLDLMTGERLWKQKRGENLYVACAQDGKVVLVGRRSMTALQLADEGKPAWEPAETPLPDESMPSGRGFFSDGHYYLPLSSAEVAKVDLSDGKIVDRAKSRDGIVPGNLICYRDEVVSLGVDSLDVFFQIEPLRSRVAEALRVNPSDAEALARMGEIEFDQQNLPEAIEHFRRSFDLVPNDLTRELLVQSLLMALRGDFSANREVAEQLDALIDQPEQRTILLRLMADGLHKSHQRLEAFEAYLKLIDMESDESELFDISSDLSVRGDRWIQARLVSLRSSASPVERGIMDREIEARRAALGEDATAGELRRFLARFTGHPTADATRRSLVEKLLEGDSPLECEMLLGRLERSPDVRHRLAATALMAELLHNAKRPEDAAIYYRLLAGELSETVCLRGKTGKEIFDSLPEDDLVRKIVAGRKTLPSGDVKDRKTVTRSSNRRIRRLTGIAVRGDPGPFFAGMSVSLDRTSQLILGYNGYGEQQFQAPLRQSSTSRRFGGTVPGNSNYNYALASGHLLLVSLGDRVFAFDTLRSSGTEFEKVLWQENLIERIPGIQGNPQITSQRNVVPGGRPRFRAVDRRRRAIGVLGPITDHGVALQSQGDLKCVDPRTGTVLWARRDLPLGCHLFGDNERLLVIPPGSSEAQVFRMSDGSPIGKRQVPPEDERMATLGSRLLRVSRSTGKYELSLLDPWKEAVIWTRSFDPSPKTWMLEDEVIGLMEATGRFVLLSLSDGSDLVDEQLEPEKQLQEIYLTRSSDQYLLITSHVPTQVMNGYVISAVPRNSGNPVVSGRVYAFDRETLEPLWPVPATIEQRALSLTQPVDVPVIAFVQQERQAGSGRRPRTRNSLLCLDKRTGRKIYATDSLSAASDIYYRLLGDPEQGTVSFVTSASTVELTFTEDPISPEPPYQDHLKRSRGQSKRNGLFDIFGVRPRPGRPGQQK